MKYADKIGAGFTVVLGDDEIKSGKAVLKNMQLGQTQEINIDNIAEDFTGILIQNSINQLADADLSGLNADFLLGGKF